MTKAELIAQVAADTKITKVDIEKVINSTFRAISNDLAKGGKTQIVGFGSFEVKERAARKGRNPRTGEPIEIAASKVPTFKPSKFLKDEVNG